MRSIIIFILFAVLLLVLTVAHGAGVGQPGELVPSRPIEQPVNPGTSRGLLYFERKHSLSVGDKGEERFNVSIKPPICGATALVFDHARIVYKRQRFGEAKIVRSPPAGCINCPPLVVRWYHEPTGYLDYQVHVYRRLIIGKCPSSKP